MVKLGIIGCGYWGPNLVRNFNSVQNAEMTHCSDKDESRLSHIKGLYPKISVTKNYEDILVNKDVDAVVIATPIETHYQIAKDALNAGKHVLVEKPITNTSSEVKELIRLAEKRSRVLMVDHTFEYSSHVRKIKEIIGKGELGRIFTIEMIRVNLGLFQEKVNVIADLAPHDFSMLLYYLGSMPLYVRATGKSYIRDGIEDDAHINLEFEGSIMANLHVSWLDPVKIRRTSIVGSKKMLVFDDVAQDEKLKIYDKGVSIEKNNIPAQPYYDTYREWVLTYRSGDIYAPKVESKEPLNVMANHFVDCIISGKKPLTDGYSGLRVVKMLEAVQKSLKEDGKKVSIKDD